MQVVNICSCWWKRNLRQRQLRRWERYYSTVTCPWTVWVFSATPAVVVVICVCCHCVVVLFLVCLCMLLLLLFICWFVYCCDEAQVLTAWLPHYRARETWMICSWFSLTPDSLMSTKVCISLPQVGTDTSSVLVWYWDQVCISLVPIPVLC